MHWESAVAPEGHDYAFPRGGPLFRIRVDVPGREPPALGALPHAGRSQQDHPHGHILWRPRIRPRLTNPS